MERLVSIVRSPLGRYKWRAIWDGSARVRHTDFGASGYSDYTIHHDRERRRRYRLRHARDHLDNPSGAGALSWHILWGPSTDMARNVRTFRTRFRV